MPRQAKGKPERGSIRSKKSTKPVTEEKEEILRAVLIAESFQDRYKPFSVEKPRCLLPLANIPLIEYSLDFLAFNDVREVWIYTGSLSDQVEAYIASSRWAPGSSTNPFSTLEFIPLQSAHSIGDLLRDLDKRSLFDGDFIVLHGDVVSNMDLTPALAAHKRRREINENTNVMTIVLREAGGETEIDDGASGMTYEPHRTRPNSAITPVFVLDSANGQCLHYDEMHALASDHSMVLDPAVPLEMSRDFELRADLIDPGIDIYTPHVLALWGEKFDAQLPRAHFLRGVLQEWELNGKRVFADVASRGYAARASSLPMYDAVARDVLDRWTFPLVPESNLMPGSAYGSLGGGTGDAVVERQVMVGQETELRRSVVAKGTAIGRGAKVTGSTIGRDCLIGDGAVIEDSFIWDKVTIGSGTTIKRSIIADGAIIGKNCFIATGSLISFNVRISDSITLPNSVVLSTVTPDNRPIAEHDTALLGPDARGAPFVDPETADLDPEDPSLLERCLLFADPHHDFDDDDSASSIGSEEGSSDAGSSFSLSGSEGPSRATLGKADRTRTMSSFSDTSAHAQDSSFRREAVAWLLDALREEGAADSLETTRDDFVALRLAKNASEHAICRAIAEAFIGRAAELMGPENEGGESLDASKSAERVLDARKGTAEFLRDIGVGAARAGIAGQVAFILALQVAVLNATGVMVDPDKAGGLLVAMLQRLYNADVVEEEGIKAWWEDEKALASDELKELRKKCRPLVEWLENAEEEDDDSDEDDHDE